MPWKRDPVREAWYKEVRDVKVSQCGRNSVPRCKRCFEEHVRCPGPEVTDEDEWDYTKKCLRCIDDGVECDFHAAKRRIPLYIFEKMTEEEQRAVMVRSERTPKRVSATRPQMGDSQPQAKIQRCDHQTSFNQPSPYQQYFNQPPFHQPTALQAFQDEEEDNQIACEIRHLFQEEPDTAETVLRLANIPRHKLILGAGHLVKQGAVSVEQINALSQTPSKVVASQQPQPQLDRETPERAARSAYPDPSECELSPSSSARKRSGFLYDGPYQKAEHDFEAEVKMYVAQKKEERKKARKAASAANSATDPFVNGFTQPSRSTRYGKSMGNGGVGTLEYLGFNWESADKEG